MKELLLLLKKFFGYTSFRPLQADIIQRILQKEDSLVLMPTGGGKSICFQLPAIYLPGTALVVSPLDRLDEGSSRGVDRQRHPGGGVEQYDAGRGATTGEATLRAGQDQIIVYLPGTDQDGSGLVPAPAGHLAHRYRRGALRIALGT